MSHVADHLTPHATSRTSFVLRHRLATLVALLLASEAIYLLAFVRRYALLTYWNVPLLDLGKIAQRKPLRAVEFLAAFLALFALYALAVRLCQTRTIESRRIIWGNGARSLMVVAILGTLVFGGTMMMVYPIGASDVFDYAIHGVLLARHHVSPLVEAGSSFPQEPFVPFSAWRYYPSYYGPLWSWLEAGIDLAAGSRDLLANLFGFKLMALAGVLCDAWLIGRIAARRASQRTLESVVLFAWNPLVIFEAATNAHNDMIMLAFVLAAFLAWERGRWIWAVVGMTLAALVKILPLPLLGLLGVAAVAQASGWTAKLRRAALSAGLVVALAGAAYLALPQGVESAFNLGGRTELFTNSLPAVVMLLLRFVAPQAIAESLTRAAASLTFATFGIWKAWQTWKKPNQLLRHSFDTILFLLLFVMPWFQPWYVTWLVALAAIYPRDAIGAGNKLALVELFSLTVTWSFIVYGFVWFWFVPQMNWGNLLGVQATGFIVTYTLPLAYFALHIITRARGSRL